MGAARCLDHLRKRSSSAWVTFLIVCTDVGEIWYTWEDAAPCFVALWRGSLSEDLVEGKGFGDGSGGSCRVGIFDER